MGNMLLYHTLARNVYVRTSSQSSFKFHLSLVHVTVEAPSFQIEC